MTEIDYIETLRSARSDLIYAMDVCGDESKLHMIKVVVDKMTERIHAYHCYDDGYTDYDPITEAQEMLTDLELVEFPSKYKTNAENHLVSFITSKEG